jgi:aryl-alcohol dehydrogenase-like predicted oxidoreductase
MQYRSLGRSSLKVSAICLGTMTWGEQNTEAEAHEQLDYAVSCGINFLDTAELYPIPPKAKTRGLTEKYIGTWMQARKNRDRIIVASKVAGRSNMDWFRDSGETTNLSRAQIFEAIDKSLKRLQADYIDLYQLHWPDRPMPWGANPVVFEHEEKESISFAETFAALEELVKRGKIRFIGLSNESAWGTMQALRLAEGKDHIRVQSIQNAYSLLNRTYETALAEIAMREQVGLLAYSPLGQGVLTGKYLGGVLPKGARKTLFGRMGRYETPGAESAIEAYVALAKQCGHDPAQLALQFVTSRPFVTSNIIGATTMAQLKTDIGSSKLKWNKGLENAVNDIHLRHTNPCP